MQVKKFLNDYKVPLGLTAGSLVIWGAGTNAEPYLTALRDPSAWRFASYVPFAVAGAEASKTFWENRKGKELTGFEKFIAYSSGAIAASFLYEGWEVAGSTEPVYNVLHSVFGDAVKQDFTGKGAVSDMIYTIGPAMAIEGIKHVARKAKGRFSRRESGSK